MDAEDVADKKMKEDLIGLQCESCRSRKCFENILEAVFQRARRRREEMKECQRRMDEAEKFYNRLITQLEN